MDLYGHLIDANLWAAAGRVGDIWGTSGGTTDPLDDVVDGETGG
jgi:hypothetical protein